MKNLVLTACVSAVLMASAAPSLAADACQTYCKATANSCREQCSDPQEQEQCIFECSRSECKANCNRLEEACTQHCPKS